MKRVLAFSIVGVAVAVLLLLGVFGISHGGWSSTNFDMAFLYQAGVYWLAGMNAYSPETVIPVPELSPEVLQRYDYAYPPNSAPLCMTLAAAGIPGARFLMTGLNVSAALFLGWLGAERFRGSVAAPDQNSFLFHLATALVSAGIIGNFTTAFVVWAGQSSLLIIAALYGGWLLAQRGRWLAAGALFALASIKPQLALLPILWLVAQGHWRVMLATGAVALILMLWPLFVLGPVELTASWIKAIGRYAAGPYNQLGGRMLFSVQNTLWALGYQVPNLSLLAPIGALVLWRFRFGLGEDATLAALLCIGLLFGYSHSYDLVALTPLVPALGAIVWRWKWKGLAGLALWLTITFPTSVLEGIGQPLISHIRVPAAFCALLWLVLAGARQAHMAAPANSRLQAREG